MQSPMPASDSPSTAPSLAETEDHECKVPDTWPTFCHMGGRLELPKEAQTHRRPPTFFGSVHPHPRGNPKGLFSHVLWLGQLIGFNFGGHSKGPRRFGTRQYEASTSDKNLTSRKLSRAYDHGTQHPTPKLQPPYHPLCWISTKSRTKSPRAERRHRFGRRDAAATGSWATLLSSPRC